MPTPRVSIGIPVYNGEKFLKTAVDSVLAQDYGDFEIIISDNASTDGTAEICGEYVASDPRVRYFRNKVNIGAVPNFNRVFTLARGEFFKWLPHDDSCHPNMLRRCVEVLDGAPHSVALVYPMSELVDEHGRFQCKLVEYIETRAKHPHQRLRRVLLGRSSALALCGLIRSDHLRRTRLRGSYVMDDMGLLAELAMVGECLQLDEVLLKIRFYEGNGHRVQSTTRSHLLWLDPTNQRRYLVLSPQVQLFLESLRSVIYVPLHPVDKALCCLTVPTTYVERPLRNFVGKWRRRLLASLNG